MSWRYQPVYVDTDVGRVYSLCEVYFDGLGNLEAWTESAEMTPIGSDDVHDLRGTLARMLADSYKWTPVAFAELKIGMTFERLATQEQMDRIAAMISAMGSAANSAAKAVN